MTQKTFFGLPVITEGTKQGYVRLADIRSLPFFAFWEQSARGTTLTIGDNGESLVFLYDWEAFCHLFIETGKHRNMY